MSKSKIKLLIISVIAIIVVSMLISILVLFVQKFGVSSVNIRNAQSDSFDVVVKYGECSTYSVKNISVDEYKYYRGERQMELPGELGKDAVAISLGDIEPTDALMKKYPAYEIHSIEKGDHNINWMWYYTDHGVCVLIGSDSSIEAVEQHNENPALISSVKAKIKVG